MVNATLDINAFYFLRVHNRAFNRQGVTDFRKLPAILGPIFITDKTHKESQQWQVASDKQYDVLAPNYHPANDHHKKIGHMVMDCDYAIGS